MASYNQSTWCKKTRSLAPLCGPLAAVGNPSQCILTKQRSSLENCTSDCPLSASSVGVMVRADPVLMSSAGTISAIHVHIGEEEVVVEMVWNKPRPNFQSALLQAVQSLGFDVTQCSISRVGNGYIQCVVTCSKSQALSQISVADTIFFDLDYQSVEEYADTELILVRAEEIIYLSS